MRGSWQLLPAASNGLGELEDSQERLEVDKIKQHSCTNYES